MGLFQDKYFNKAIGIIAIAFLSLSSFAIAGCSEDQLKVSEKMQRKVVAPPETCEEVADDTGSTSSWNGGKITVEDIEACQSREEYLQLVMPCYQYHCQQYGIKFPGVLALQGIYEAGVPNNISNVMRSDNNMGGLKYSSAIPHAQQGSAVPSNESGGCYCRFNSIDEYIEAAVWNIAHDGSPYGTAMSYKDKDVTNFTRALCNMWIGGVEPGNPPGEYGYSEYVIADYEKYGLSKYEGGMSRGQSNHSSSNNNSSSSSANGASLVGDDNAAKIWNYLKAEGYSDEQAAGIMGNFQRESNFEPNIIQGGQTFETIPESAMQEGNMVGYGIAQWTWYTYCRDLHEFAQRKGKKDCDLQTQLEYFSTTFADQKEEYCKLKGIAECTTWFHDAYERSADTSMAQRISFAEEIYARFKGTAETNASQTSHLECGNEKGKQTYGTSGVASGNEYHQTQGNGDNCGATSFLMAVNMLIGENKYTDNVAEWSGDIFQSDSTRIGGDDKPQRWLEKNKLENTIEVENVSGSMSVDDVKQWLNDGYVVVTSSAGAIFKQNDGTYKSLGPHYILVYRYENGSFYINDPGSSAEQGAGVKYSEEDLKKFFAARPDNNMGLKLKRK